MPALAAQLPTSFTDADRAEASGLLRDGVETAWICGYFGCTPEELATECPAYFEPAGTYADTTTEGLTAQIRRALLAGPMTSRAVADALGHERSGEASSILSTMARHDIVSVTQTGEHRKRLFALTEKGRALVVGAGPRLEAVPDA